ncbi:MAG: ABC transporter permease [Candidatus Colwellbacteria bacterium]|nr:ABC transporter permease [Candidatus Colwellbacteria bacterium]
MNTWTDIKVLTWRNLIYYTRDPRLMIFSSVQPVIFLLLFTYVFGGAIKTSVDNYITYLLPGIIIQVALFGSMMTGIALSTDLSKGIMDRLRSLPIAHGAILAGRTITDIIRNIFVLILMIGLGYLIGFETSAPLGDFILGILIALMFGFVFSWISATIGLAVKNPETAQVAGFIWLFPLMFVSSIFVPISTMPDWLQAFAERSPITYTVDAVRALWLGGDFEDPLLYSLLWSGVLLLIFVPLAIRAFKRAAK